MKPNTTFKKKAVVTGKADEDKSIKDAINNVYKKYGTDLDAFFRDVHDELEIKRQEIKTPRR